MKNLLRSHGIKVVNNSIPRSQLKLAISAINKDIIPGGKSDKIKSGYDVDQLCKGIKIEMEHTDDPFLALEIATDHLFEIPNYYDLLETMENKAK